MLSLGAESWQTAVMAQSRTDAKPSAPPAAPDTAPGKRARHRAEMMRRIGEVGRAQLQRDGVDGLSLREVTRELGVVSSAVYRYVASRDDLLTLLLVDAFTALADAVDAEDRAGAGLPSTARFRLLARRTHGWAREHPQQWTLLYGTPVAGYSAPAEQTTGPGIRVLARMAEIGAGVAGADDAGAGGAPSDASGTVPAELEETLDAGLREVGVEADVASTLVALAAWSGLVGAINAEVFGQWGPELGAVASPLFEAQVEVLAGLFGSAD
jgi:AcrR family transcriptional regulator